MSEKQVQIVIKLPLPLREAFVKTCKDMDSNAAREVRGFMREYIAKNSQKTLDF